MQDTRSCMHTISIGPFFAQTVNDPVCEAAKAAQNQTYQVQSQACESRKEADKAENEWKRERCLAVANACSNTLPLADSTKFAGARVLWVDDHPDNNAYERQALAELGATVATVTDTDQAMAQFTGERKQFDVIISDFSRTGDPNAAYTLLKRIRHLAEPPPLVIYSAGSTPALAAEAVQRGAFGETNRPKELLSLVIRSVAAHRDQRRQRSVSK